MLFLLCMKKNWVFHHSSSLFRILYDYPWEGWQLCHGCWWVTGCYFSIQASWNIESFLSSGKSRGWKYTSIPIEDALTPRFSGLVHFFMQRQKKASIVKLLSRFHPFACHVKWNYVYCKLTVPWFHGFSNFYSWENVAHKSGKECRAWAKL